MEINEYNYGIYNMPLFESIVVNEGEDYELRVTKVPGGWIIQNIAPMTDYADDGYTEIIHQSGRNPVFVPYHEEFI